MELLGQFVATADGLHEAAVDLENEICGYKVSV